MNGSGDTRSGSISVRSAARLAAVQALYQMDIAAAPVETVIREFVVHRFPAAEGSEVLPGAEPQFFADVVRGVVRRQRDIDPLISRTLAAGWRLVRIDSILRAILRAATFELLERLDVPARAVINEYVNTAHAFFGEEEPKVVNGVLDRIARQLRPAEFPQTEPGST